jgi:hypothetical protein
MRSPNPAKEGALDPLTRNKVTISHRCALLIQRNQLLSLQLHATWSKSQWLAHIKDAAAKERAHISEVIHAKKQRDEEYGRIPLTITTLIRIDFLS